MVKQELEKALVRTRVLIADDHKVVRRGLRALLKDQQDLDIVGEADDGRAAVEMARELEPDVIIMDAVMPGLSGALATKQLQKQCPNARVVALSMHSDKRYVADMLKAGASAYLLKTCDVSELVHAITIAAAGRTYLSPDVAEAVVEAYVNPLEAGPSRSQLTDREREVLQLLAEGKSAKQTGVLLHVSSRTTDSHRQRIMDKLGLYSVAELTKYAVRAGLTSLED